MKDIAYYAGTMGAGGKYTTGAYVTPGTEGDFYRGVFMIILGLILLIIAYIFWINRK